MKLKQFVSTVALAISAGLTVIAYLLHFDEWLSSIYKRPNVPLGVVWAWMLVVTAVIVPMWQRSFNRVWEAPIMAGAVFIMPLVLITDLPGSGRLMSAERNAKLLLLTWAVGGVLVVYAIVADCFYIWVRREKERDAQKR